MFEDALVESSGRIRTHRGWFSGVATMCNGSFVCLLLVWPLLHPASLPRQTISMLIAAPAPPVPPMIRSVAAEPAHPAAVPLNPFTAPPVIPNSIAQSEPQPPATENSGIFIPGQGNGSLTGLADSIGTAVPAQVRVSPQKRPAISSGVMEGRRLGGADPRYPAIAAAARVQGTVVLEATISKAGMIENLRVVSGPPMLIGAAEDAVRTWRYRPYQLNGEAVAVETTINVVFRLGS
ncbi:MAG TPA: TonB family protein [Acidobacteriaceae bacterium]